MKHLLIYLVSFFVFISDVNAEDKEKTRIPDKTNWENTNDRDNSSPQLYQDNYYVYIYSEKELDNLSIGITDMQGNVYHEEVTLISAEKYYAISIESLPLGEYYLCVYQNNNYVIGIFTKK